CAAVAAGCIAGDERRVPKWHTRAQRALLMADCAQPPRVERRRAGTMAAGGEIYDVDTGDDAGDAPALLPPRAWGGHATDPGGAALGRVWAARAVKGITGEGGGGAVAPGVVASAGVEAALRPTDPVSARAPSSPSSQPVPPPPPSPPPPQAPPPPPP